MRTANDLLPPLSRCDGLSLLTYPGLAAGNRWWADAEKRSSALSRNFAPTDPLSDLSLRFKTTKSVHWKVLGFTVRDLTPFLHALPVTTTCIAAAFSIFQHVSVRRSKRRNRQKLPPVRIENLYYTRTHIR